MMWNTINCFSSITMAAKMVCLVLCFALFSSLTDAASLLGAEKIKRDTVSSSPKEHSGHRNSRDNAFNPGPHESFYQMPALREASVDLNFENFKTKNPVDIRRASLTPRGEFTYQGENQTTAKDNDPCPMTWVLNVDTNRNPEVMVEGQCSSNCSCLGGPLLRCQDVKYYVKVLRKIKEGNYVSILEPITVGCACRKSDFRTLGDKVDIKNH